jgi:hypothetical protein
MDGRSGVEARICGDITLAARRPGEGILLHRRGIPYEGAQLLHHVPGLDSTPSMTTSPITITVEQAARAWESRLPDPIGPIVGFRNWRIFRTGPAARELSSPYLPVSWAEPVMRAECRRWCSPEDLLREPHAAPHPDCRCGIRAYRTPTGDFSQVDYRGVSGIVTLWGRIEIDRGEMRAELARVEALGVYRRWNRRQQDAVREVASKLGADIVDLHDLDMAAADYGEPPPPALPADPRARGIRDRFAALFT